MMQVNDLWFQAFRVLALKCMDFILDGHFKDSKIGHRPKFYKAFLHIRNMGVILSRKVGGTIHGFLAGRHKKILYRAIFCPMSPKACNI